MQLSSIDKQREIVHGATTRAVPQRLGKPGAFLAAALFALICAVPSSRAQNYINSIGQTTFTAPEPADLGFVETANGNLHLEIPMGTFPQRGGGAPLTVKMDYDSNIWLLNPNYGGPVWQPTNVTGSGAGYNGGWHLVPGNTFQLYGYYINGCNYSDFFFTDRNGTYHYFPIKTSGPPSYGCTDVPNGDAFATDSTGYRMYVTGYTNTSVYAPDGSLIFQGPATQLNSTQWLDSKDTNGNYETNLQLGTISTDMLGRNLLGSGAGCPSGSVCYDIPNSQGGTSRWTIAYTNITANTHFGVSGVVECSSPNCTTIPVVKSITLPDGSAYTFKYDCDIATNTVCSSPTSQTYFYATMTSMTLPTGGTTTYSYTTFTDAYGNKGRWLYSRYSVGGYWSYSPQVISKCSSSQVGCQQTMTVTKPNGDTTVYTFTLNNGAWPSQVQQYRGSAAAANLMSTTTTAWDFSQPCALTGCHGAGYIRKLSDTTTVPAPGGTSLTKKTTFTYDSPQKANMTAIKEWRFYPGTTPTFPAVPDRATYLSYYTAGNNIINKPLVSTTCNNSGSDADCPGGGSKVRQTKVSYDSYGSNGLTLISGIVNHDDTNFGSGFTARGNATSVQQWVSGTTYATTQYTYDTTGQILSVSDPKGNITGYSHTDAYYNDNGANPPATYTPAAPTNAYLTKITLPTVGSNSMTQTFGYYFGRGKQAIVTNQNGAKTYSHFMDPLDRPTETNFPIGWDLITYTSASQADTYIPVNDASPSTACTSCRHNQTNLDSFGRKVNQKLVNAPGGAINIDTTYDSIGRVQSVSHAYVNTSDPSHVFETFAYDALNRQLAVTHPDGQSSLSGFGVNVAGFGGITGQQSSPATYGYGYPIIVVDESGKQIQQWIDGFGQIIEVDEPSTSTGTAGRATLTVNGNEQWFTVDPCAPCEPMGCPACPHNTYDSGSVSVTVNGFTATANYQGWDGNIPNSSSVAADLASALNVGASPVVAVRSGSSITMTAKGPGASTNFSFTTSYSYDTSNFSSRSFWATPSPGALTGGSGGIASSPLVTAYTYTAIGLLKQVNQGVQTRTFNYDGLGRRTSMTMPESGTDSFYFTQSDGVTLCAGDFAAVCRRTDARGITTTYSYDALNRLTGKTYSNGQGAVSYQYDQGGAAAFALGQLTKITDPSGSETPTYDIAGRVTQVQKVIGTTTYSTSYHYNPAGQITQITYPSGRAVQQSVDGIGRVQTIASGTTNYVSVPSSSGYNSAGQLLGFSYGNGVAANFGYSANRQQMSSLSYVKGTTTLFSLNYYYQKDTTNCPNAPTANDGPIQCIQDGVDTGRTVAYTYDALNRLATAVTSGSTTFPKWGISESYDRYGNRLSQSQTAGAPPMNALSFATTAGAGAYTNHPDGYSFDPSGSMLNDGNNTLAYDDENCMTTSTNTSSGTSTYTCDAHAIRVKKSLATGTTTVYVYSGGKDIAEYDNGAAPTSPTREYIYLGNLLAATITGSITTYHHRDHLSVRVSTDSTGAKIGEQGHYPFGESWYSTNSTSKFIFTTYERDSESQNDYALARYYINRFGRFSCADPMLGTPADPQSWNRYAYVRNNPINNTDPTGLSWLSRFFRALVDFFAGDLSAALNAQLPAPGTTPPTFPTESESTGDWATLIFGPPDPSLINTNDGWGGNGFANSAGTGQVPLSDRDLARFEANRADLLRQLADVKDDCAKLLAKLGYTPDQVRKGVGDQVPWNGTGSSISNQDAGTGPFGPRPTDAQAAASYDWEKTAPVSSQFKDTATQTTWAVSQLNGPNVYYRPGGIRSMKSSDPGTILHETLHNLGKTDEEIQTAWGLPTTGGSDNITKALIDHKCVNH